MKKFLLQCAAFLGMISAASLVLADNSTGVGAVAINMLEPVGVFSDFLYSGCWIIGGSFVFASIIKYFEHKRSPLMVPISTVVFLLIAGGILIALPFLSLYGDPSIRFTFFDLKD
ncbi:MAG TPA: hypothetical protein VFU82_07160 [Gammaproteobacteria bacterium]|jgi:hypothetical protein|nr:hypothetical protein [Gammaproteobacteria bacterium]